MNSIRNNNNNSNNMKRSSSSNSDTYHDSQSPHSPLRFHSPLRSDQGDPPETPPYMSPASSPHKPQENSKAIVAVADKYTQCSRLDKLQTKRGDTTNTTTTTTTTPVVVVNRAVKVGEGETTAGVTKPSVVRSIGRGSRRDEMVNLASLGFRVSEVVLSLISFSVMAADRTQGWSGDSFDRYKEYRYCLTVNVIAFVYSAFQAYDLAYHIVTGKHVINHHLRRQFDFFMDQILAYLLISSSSSAASRVDDWQSNWGKDQFTEMASASVAMSFLAFFAFAISSIISAYNLWKDETT
ncbi:hypothetical protein ACFE04_017914 [Oxalis oulophora]